MSETNTSKNGVDIGRFYGSVRSFWWYFYPKRFMRNTSDLRLKIFFVSVCNFSLTWNITIVFHIVITRIITQNSILRKCSSFFIIFEHFQVRKYFHPQIWCISHKSFWIKIPPKWPHASVESQYVYPVFAGVRFGHSINRWVRSWTDTSNNSTT